MGKGSIALKALEGFFAGVCFFMRSQTGPGKKSHLANAANVIFFPVTFFVKSQFRMPFKSSSTDCTFERPLILVDEIVLCQIFLVEKGSPAYLTFEL